jgi:LacI family transcriptional regulator
MPNASTHFDVQIAFGIHDSISRYGYVPINLWTPGVKSTKADHDNVIRQVHDLIDRRVDGIVLRPDTGHEQTYISEIWERNVPMITVDSDLLESHSDFVGTNDHYGARLAVEHLLELGHRYIAHISGPTSWITARDRRIVFEDLIASVAGARCQIIVDESYGFEKKNVEKLFSLDPMPTAVFAANDFIAAQIYEIAYERSVRIPEDISVIGYGDLDFATLLKPAITTIRQDPYQIGQIAGRMAMERIEKQVTTSEHRRVLLKPELIVRSSTAPIERLESGFRKVAEVDVDA